MLSARLEGAKIVRPPKIGTRRICVAHSTGLLEREHVSVILLESMAHSCKRENAAESILLTDSELAKRPDRRHAWIPQRDFRSLPARPQSFVADAQLLPYSTISSPKFNSYTSPGPLHTGLKADR